MEQLSKQIIDLFIINITILILYVRTYKYKYLIDDFVPRGGYLLVLGDRPKHYSFYDTQRPILATITNIGVYMATCGFIYLLWGFWPAMLFAVMPTNVSGVAWNTGNYYMSTVLLILCTHYLFTTCGWLGAGLAIAFYVAALGSTVSAIPYAFYTTITSPIGYIFIIPLLFFLFGNRFQTGLRLRKEKHALIKVESGKISWRAIFVMTKVIGYYIMLSFIPSRLGFFHSYPKYAHSDKPDRLFYLTLILCAVFAMWGLTVNWQMTLWFFLFIGIFSQFTTFGMFVAERYMYVANVAICVLIALYLPQDGLYCTIVAVSWFWLSFNYIRAYKSNMTLCMHSISAFPETPENYNNLASHYLERGDKIKAIEPLLCALQLTTVHSPGLHMNLANCFAQAGMFTKALHHTEEALKYCAENDKEPLNRQRNDLLDRLRKISINKKELKRKGII